MKKYDGGKNGSKKKPIAMKEVKVTAKRPKVVEKKSVTKSGEVPTRKIDSIRRANPAAGRAIGKPMKGSGGMDTYGDSASDVIKAALKKKK